MGARVSSPELIGRERQLGTLLAALEGAAEGRAATVFLAGESGVGKSRLLDELTQRAEQDGARVLVGECVTLAAGELPYGAIRAALRPLGPELRALPEAEREQLARLLPQLGAAGAPMAGLAATGERLGQAHLFEVLLGVLGRLAEARPLVLAIEDIHWADPSTLDFLAFLIANVRRERLALVCSYRTDELHRQHALRPFLAQHERRSDVARVELDPFTLDELHALVEAILGAPPDPRLVRRLHLRAEGNAFFTEELLAASGREQALPASVRDALMLRIEQLSASAQTVLRLAATHGRLVTHRLLAAAAHLPEPALHEAIREAVAHHVLVRRDEETFAFRHALLVEALTSDSLPGERAGFHLALAGALDADPTLSSRDGRAAAEACAHWLGAHRLPEALAAAVRAAQEAEEVYAFAEAAHHYMRALELWDQVDAAEQLAGMDAPELHARAAEAAAFGDDGPAAMRLIRAAIAMVDPTAERHRSALLRERLAHYHWVFSGDSQGAERAYREAVALLPLDEPCPALALSLASLAQCLVLRGCTPESVERAAQAIDIARRTGARDAEALALNALGTGAAFLGDRDTGIARLRESLDLAEAIAHLDVTARSYVNLSEILDQDGRIAESIELALRGAERVRSFGLRDFSLLLEGEAAARLLKLGRLDEADTLTRHAVDLRPSLAKLDQCAVRARLLVHRGEADTAATLLRAADAAMPGVPTTWNEPIGSARLELALLRGRPDEARELGERSLGPVAEDEHLAFVARLHALTARAGAALAERARRAGDTAALADACARIRALEAELDRRLDPSGWRGSPPPEAVVQRALCAAEAARAAGEATPEVWAEVRGRSAAMGLALEEAYARLRGAECLVLAGDRAAAAETLGAGLDLARAAGARWLADEQRALARRARLTSVLQDGGDGADAQGASLGLTDRELAVLELLAEGLTNRQIGERLFMAQKTASVHVSRILSKLDVDNRVEAATAAQRLGLVR
ncbi:MAG TPA: AAA family ATPase [Solirubrobacteraceae bacterium]|nr:AAA family ATPase [Solirubrobacteraceae bacterium]